MFFNKNQSISILTLQPLS